MNNYKLTLQYDGTRYSGWQRQGNTDNTIEDKLSMVITRMTESADKVEVYGSGRTDAGVHALGQVANFKTEKKLPEEYIINYMNKYLPEDIRVVTAEQVDIRFHARLNAKSKTYIYRIDENAKADVFNRKYAFGLGRMLDINRIREVSSLFVGTKDYRAFSDMKSDNKSSVRSVYSIEAEEEDGIITITYNGNGFLYHMVRKITAAIIDFSLSELSKEEIIAMFEKCDRNAFKKIAPPQGLFLKSVSY